MLFVYFLACNLILKKNLTAKTFCLKSPRETKNAKWDDEYPRVFHIPLGVTPAYSPILKYKVSLADYIKCFYFI